MTYDTIETVLNELGLPYAYFQFKSKPRSIPYVAYFEDEKLRFMADDKVYRFEPHFAIELYTTKKDPELENRLIELFDQHEVPGPEVKLLILSLNTCFRRFSIVRRR